MLASVLCIALILVQSVFGQELIPFYQRDDFLWELTPLDWEIVDDGNQLAERSLSYSYMCHFKSDMSSAQCVPVAPVYTNWQPITEHVEPQSATQQSSHHSSSPVPVPTLAPAPQPSSTPNYYAAPPLYPQRMSVPAFVPTASMYPLPNTVFALPLSAENPLATRLFVDDLFNSGSTATSILNSITSLPLLDAIGGRHLLHNKI